MKTFRTVLVTILVFTVLVMTTLFKLNIVSIDSVEQEHNCQVIVDGKEVSNGNWNETLGFNIKLSANGQAYVGK